MSSNLLAYFIYFQIINFV